MKIPMLFLYWGLWYLVFSSRTILSPLLPLIEPAIGINHAMAGSFFLSFYIGFTIALFSSGPVSLYLGYKRTIFVSLLLMMVSYVVLKFTTTYYLFIVVCVALGFSAGFYVPCAIPLITASFDKKHWGKAISFHETAAGFNIFSIPFLVVIALRMVSWPSVFLVMAVFALAMALVLMAFSPDPRPAREQQARLSAVLRRTEFWVLSCFWIACSAASMGVYSILPLFLVNERAMAIDAANTIFGFSRIGGFVAMILVGFILDRFSVRKIMLVLLLATGLTTIAIAVIQVHWLLVAMLFAQATFPVIFFPVGLVAISRLTSLSERSIFTGATMGVSTITGSGVSPVVLGAVADHWNFQIGILSIGILVIAICFLNRFMKDI
jgi:NNP family nitrate/nitrite transporter-like MFS transporter